MTAPAQPPSGFRDMALPGGYFVQFGPLYARLDAGVPVMGFFIDEQHINPLGVCHGGVISGFADMQALGAQYTAGVTDRFTPTIHLTVDYVSPAQRGEWVEMRVELLKATRGLLFTQALIKSGERLVARSSGVFKIGSSPHSDPSVLQGLFR